MINKRGLQIAFGMIFSIILIAVIIAISFFVINYFLNLNECAEVSLFYNDFQNKVDTIWSSELASDEFTGRLPSGIETVCFGLLENGEGQEEYLELRTFRNRDANIFLLPVENACDIAFANIKHVKESGFQCFRVSENRVSIPLDKGSFDSLVSVGGN